MKLHKEKNIYKRTVKKINHDIARKTPEKLLQLNDELVKIQFTKIIQNIGKEK